MNISLGEKWHYCINMETIWRYSMKNGAILAVVLEDHENDRNRLISFIARYAQEHSVKIETGWSSSEITAPILICCLWILSFPAWME